MDNAPLIFDVDESVFQSLVVEASHQTPVAVDFWAQWCAPCRALKPVLEKVVASLAGKVRLAKVNTDQNQRLASALGIRSLPTVKLVKNAKVVDEFYGAYPEAQVREFLSRQINDNTDELSAEVEALLAKGLTKQALVLLRQALAADPDDPRRRLDLAAAEIAHGDYRSAEATLQDLAPEARKDDRAKHIFAQLHFYRLCEGAPAVDDLRRAVELDPKNLDARLKLSARNVLEENYEAALDQLLEVVRRNKNYRDDVARKSMLSVFDLLGKGNPLVGRYRSLMAAAIY